MGGLFSPTPEGGAGGGGLLGALAGAIGGAASTTGIISSMADAILRVVNYVSAAIIYTQSYGNALTGYTFISLGNVIKALGRVVQTIKDSWLGGMVSSLWQHVRNLAQKLKDWAQKIHDIIKQIKKMQDDYFKHYVQPVFDFIQRLRKMLLIFRVFHLKFAERLDSYLAGLEARIARNFLRVRADLNRLSDYINLALDPTGHFHLGIYLDAAKQSADALSEIIFGTKPKPANQTVQEQLDAQAHMYDRPQALAYIHTVAATGPTAEDQAIFADYQKSFVDMGYTV